MEKVLNQILETQSQILKTLQQQGEQLQTLNNRVGGLEKGQTRLGSKVDKIEIRMENEVIDRIRALFDNREVQNDRLERIENKLDDMATDVSYVAAKIAVSGKLAK
ncbi:MAG: hypothetical protein JL50_03175 [Peptococcaceae bacterium BICA1-7]|nr:MAG: hypothetical protein JL50_03175 [Peptococcaceae bacterium BICA1-7]HBV97733.1 hypothetical protein [Desulfotomaculum sp.]